MINTVLDFFLPEDFRGDLDKQRHGRVLVLAAWGSVLAVTAGTFARHVNQPMPFGYLVLFCLSSLSHISALLLLKTTGRRVLAGYMIIFASIIPLMIFCATTGGLHQPVIVILPFLPLLGSFLVGRRTGTALTVLGVVFLICLFYLHHRSSIFTSDLNTPETLVTARFGNLLMALVLSTFLGGIFERQRRETERGLLAARKIAEKSSAARGYFLANMSHEIRTPIGGILGVADVLTHLELSPEAREYVEIISSSADNLLHLVNDVLDLSKIDAGKMTLETLDFRFEEPIRGVIALLRPTAIQKDLHLHLDLGPDLPRWVRGDPTRLRQVLFNLVGNAIKFTEQGAIHVQVRFQERIGRHAHVTFQVRDPGVGIEAENIERLFLPFAQADDSTAREFGGSGLGLAISQRIVELLGGEITARSTPGKGSVFSFTIPMETLRELGSTLGSSDAVPKVLSSRAGCHILVAEDDPVSQMIMGRLLDRMGFSADLVDNGQAALDALAEKEYDLVLLDCQMPGLDGYETCRRIRASLTRHVPVIAATAHAMEGDREKCLLVGMDDFLSKPYRQDDLAAVLDRWLIVKEDPPASSTEPE